MAKSKATIRPRTTPNEKERKPYLIGSILIPLLLLLLIGGWYYRAGISYYIQAVFNKSLTRGSESKKHDARNIFLMSQHDEYVFGIDVSQYQGEILWDSVLTINQRFPIDFIFIRATMGENGTDKRFDGNWVSANKRTKLRGAYHYYRPNENSLKQAHNFIRQVKLEPGDLPPVLDIEERPKHQSMDSLKVGLKRWLDTVESHYGIKPIVYSGDSYYTDFLEEEFKDYVVWIANYNFWIENPKEHWDFWQFSEKGSVNGIDGPVDLNMYRGGIEQLENLCLPYE